MNPTFNLPDKKVYSGAVAGSGKTLGLTNGLYNYGLTGWDSSTRYLNAQTNLYDTNLGTARTTAEYIGGLSFGVTTNPTKSGMIVETDSDLVVCIRF